VATIDAMRGIRERLDRGVVVGAEGYLFELERRGWVKAGPFVPEVAACRATSHFARGAEVTRTITPRGRT